MVSKITLLVLLGLLAGKLLVRPEFRGILRRFDRFINVLLIALAIAYGVQLLLLWL
jgi:cytochrome c biogenesis protein CcdA